MSRPKVSTIAPAPANPADAKYKGHVFLRNVPSTTRQAFKIACAQTNMTMRDVLLLLMRKYAGAIRKKKTAIYLHDLYQLDANDNSSDI